MTITFQALEKFGRLGNQLFEIASTLGIARARGEEPALPTTWSYRAFFSIPDRYYSDEPGTPAWTYATHLDERTRPYLQDLSLWRDVADEVRQWFAPSQEAELYVSRLSGSNWASRAIALHFRRGDNMDQDGYYWHPTLDYYAKALALLPATAPVLVFSDDIPWCRGALPAILGPYRTDYFEGTPRPKENEPGYATAPVLDWVDLFLMAKCAHHILPNSTYSWWGAWLSGDPSPIYPGAWYGPKITYADAGLMFPSSWRCVTVPPEPR